MKKSFKQMIRNKKKTRQIKIDKKPSVLVEIKEENRFISKASYYIFTFLF